MAAQGHGYLPPMTENGGASVVMIGLKIAGRLEVLERGWSSAKTWFLKPQQMIGRLVRSFGSNSFWWWKAADIEKWKADMQTVRR